MTLVRAVNILGANKVITAEQASHAWGLRMPEDKPIIRYNENTLHRCAKESENVTDGWYLIYCRGLSLQEQRSCRGTDPNEQPCFNKEKSDWWLNEDNYPWAFFKPEAGYYLINFYRGDRAQPKQWIRQEEEIIRQGCKLERCPLAIFTEAIFTIFMATPNHHRVAFDWCHDSGSFVTGSSWPAKCDAFSYASAGNFRYEGLGIYENRFDFYGSVAVHSRKFDL